MFFFKTGAIKPEIEIDIEDHYIHEPNVTKFVEVSIDSYLAWKYHINYISRMLKIQSSSQIILENPTSFICISILKPLPSCVDWHLYILLG